MTQPAIAKKQSTSETLEQVLLTGDLKNLKPDERIMYYKQTCESLGLNPLTKPFEYITLNGKLTLYARKDATDQLRKVNGVSIEKPDIQQIDDLIIVTVAATDANGRSDSDIGVVKKNDMGGNVANALMKAVTKAKRRVTLSICGLGMLDETEVETIPQARPAGKGELIEDARRAAYETHHLEKGLPIETEPTEAEHVANDERLSDLSEIKTLCKDLMAAGDDVPWMTKQILCDYAGQLFGLDVKSNDDLTNEQVRALKEDLTERLDALR
jgi:hypothetical protein